MLETTPRHWSGVVCIWIEGVYPRSYAEQPAWDSWNSFSRAHELTQQLQRLGSYNPCGQWVWSLRGGASGVGDWVRRKELLVQTYVFNEHTSSHTFYNFETAWGFLHWSWCLFPGLFKLVQEDLDPAVCYNITAVITTGWLCYTT